MKSRFILLVLSLVSLLNYAQTIEQNEIFKNTITLNVGIFPIDDIIYPTMSAQYERVLVAHKIGHVFGISFGGGLLDDNGDIYTMIFPRAYWLIGKKSSKLELAVGGAMLIEDMFESIVVIPSFAVGFRYQKKSKRMLYKVGVGLPDGIYASIGISF